MKKSFFIAALLIAFFNCFSQQTPKSPEEIEAYIKNLQKKADSIQQVIKSKTGNTKPITPTANKPVKSIKEKEIQQLPKPDSTKINILPKKVFSPGELKTYLNNLYDQLCKKFAADAVASAKLIANKLDNDPDKLNAAALHAWQNGAAEEAVLLVTKGATAGNGTLVMVNAGALLDMYGLSDKAIPVLRTMVTYTTNNVIALNNLGQAYTALGMRDSAMQYFSRCLSLSPQHPEANTTAGLIELEKGNKAKAQFYFENAIRGGFNNAAYAGLKSILKEKCRIRELVKPKIKFPEYFNQFKYQLPRQCENVNDAAEVQNEFDAFKKMMQKEIQQFNLLEKEAEKKMGPGWIAASNNSTMERVMKGENYLRPFQVLGSIVAAEAELGYHDDLNDLQKFETDNREQYKQLQKDYDKEHEQLMSAGGGCAKENALKNKYLERFAQVNSEW